MSEASVIIEEFEVLLREIIEKAQRGDEQALSHLDIVKVWLKNN
ncbi:Uncharacterized protein BC067498_05519 [Bacillus cereus]|nr:Uncharacterized protein BC067498_05519 [Bacillus cereus]